MFTAIAPDPKLLRDTIDTVAQIIDEGIFKMGPQGIELIAADRAVVAVVDLKIGPQAFESLQADSEVAVGLNLLNFLTILKRAGPQDKVMIRAGAGNKVEVTLKGESVRNFSIPVLDIPHGETPSTTQFEFPAGVEISSGILTEGVADADTVADSVIFEIGEGFRIAAQTDASATELKLEKGSPALTGIKASQPVKSRYPLEYLKKMVKAEKLSEKARIFIGNDYPMKMEFDGGAAKITFILAPRVSED
ncbi:MAG: hypothetical protein HY362_01080 [Candidatus Aenigmarchaeota archaeon]|nr:hypothetical protein [Candidatus Aenigmarchaeota archaeon]